MNSGVLSRLAVLLIQSSLLIAVVLALRAVSCKRLDKRLRYYLWLPVMLRLLLPFSIGSRLSVMNLFRSASHAVTVRPQISAGAAMLTDATNVVDQTAAVPASAQALSASFPWKTVLLCVWLIGIAVVAMIAVSVNVRFYSSLKKDRREAEIELLPELCERFGIKHFPAIYISDMTESPCAVGLFRPAIYLPEWAVSDRERLRYILMHELTHIKYRDNLFSLLILVCCAVYWFDPLVWIMMYSARRDRELACDAWVTGGMEPGEKTAYGMALVSSVETQLGFDLPVCAPAFASRRKEMVDRIVSIKNGKLVTKRAAVIVCSVMLLALVTVGTSAKNVGNNVKAYDESGAALAYISSSAFENSTSIFFETVSLYDQYTVMRLKDSLTPGKGWESLNSRDQNDPDYYDDSLRFYDEYHQKNDEKLYITIPASEDPDSANTYQVIEKNNEGYVFWPNSDSSQLTGTYMRMSNESHESFREVIKQITDKTTSE